jgi:hypothetical protein
MGMDEGAAMKKTATVLMILALIGVCSGCVLEWAVGCEGEADWAGGEKGAQPCECADLYYPRLSPFSWDLECTVDVERDG